MSGVEDAAGGRLAANLVHFGRVLRRAGLPVGTGQILDALRAAELVDVTRRDELYWALHAVFVHAPAQRELFDQAFRLFWREPGGSAPPVEGLREALRLPSGKQAHPRRRVAEALAGADAGEESPQADAPPAADAALTASGAEALRTRDFRDMSAEEIRRARRAVERLPLTLEARPTRRFRPDARGPRVDARATLRAMLRAGGGRIPLQRRRRRVAPPPLVVLCDISGSMERYTRMLLHFLHVLTSRRGRVRTFLFGTRLTEVTRDIARRDVDDALRRLGRRVEDWGGGTRIGRCLEEFNRAWARRVLGQGAVVLIITDGLDRDGGEGLERAAARLRRSCRRLVWLNPLLRFQDFEPTAAGVRALLPHVDEHRPVHDLASLEALAEALARPGVRMPRGRRPAAPWVSRSRVR